MNEKILFVDDEPNVLAGYARQLRKTYTVETAPGGAEALDLLDARGPFAVVVSDMRMPGMDGAAFLARARERHPDLIRVLLTGYADIPSAIDAVNQGGIFRFLTKPCPLPTLAGALDAALGQYRLVTAERELLDKTLRGSVQVLGEILALVNPGAFGRAVRVQQLVRRLAPLIPGADRWEVDVAAVLSQLGCIALPEEVLSAANRGANLNAEDRQQLDSLPEVTRRLLGHIPRLDEVLAIIAYQGKAFDAPAQLALPKCGKQIPLGARLLKAAFDFDVLVSRGLPEAEALDRLGARTGGYDPDVLTGLGSAIARDEHSEICELSIGELVSGMILAEDLHNDGGVLLLSRGNPITEPLKRRLANAANRGQAARRIRVLVPRADG